MSIEMQAAMVAGGYLLIVGISYLAYFVGCWIGLHK